MYILKKFKFDIAALLAILILFLSYNAFGFDIDKKNIAFLESYGWKVEKHYTDSSEIIVPSPFDMVYENYNLIQLDAGLDLRPYTGKSGTRYTYIVTNYPVESADTVYANVIVIDGECVAGDIMTIPIDGFIHPLSFVPYR